jgi:hypothetical protein
MAARVEPCEPRPIHEPSLGTCRVKTIRNDRPEPISVGRPPAVSRFRIISVVVRFAVVVEPYVPYR